MAWKDKAAAGFFIVVLLASFGAIAYVVTLSREERQDKEATQATQPAGANRDVDLVRGLVQDFGRAVQRNEPDAACILLAGDAYARFDCRFGRQDVPKDLRIADDAQVGVGEVVVEGDQALTELRGADQAQPVRLERQGRRWRIIRVGLPRPS